MKQQPDDYTCGPTCLHAVYNYYNDDIQLEDVISQVDRLEDGGTLGVMLANHALQRIVRATGPDPSKERLIEVYGKLQESLQNGEMFQG